MRGIITKTKESVEFWIMKMKLLEESNDIPPPFNDDHDKFIINYE